MNDFGEAFRKPKEDSASIEKPKFLLPQPCSYIPFLPSQEEEKKQKKKYEKKMEGETGKEVPTSDEYMPRYIVTPATPPPVYVPGPGNEYTAPPEYIPEPMFVPMMMVPVLVPVLLEPVANPNDINNYNEPTPSSDDTPDSTLTAKQRRNKKRNAKRRGENRKEPIYDRDTRDIPPTDPYWLDAFEKAVVPITARYVNRYVTMSDGARVQVRSFADGTIMAIRGDIPVIIQSPCE